jgi:signal peptidase I
LYNGNWRKAALFIVGVPLAAALALALVVTLPVPRLNLLPMLVPTGLQVAAIFDAVREARVPRADGRRPRYSRWYVCAALVLFNAFLWVPVEVAALRTSVAQAFKIPTGGMEPTVLIGDHVLANKFAYGVRDPLTDALMWRRRVPQRDELIVFRYPEDRRRVFLKRVIGLPGETIEIRDRQVVVDGQPILEPYAKFLDNSPDLEGRRNWGPETVPAGHLFVLGDNRDNNRDSRYWGFLPMDDVQGQARVVYLSTGDPARSWLARPFLIRWRRLGQILR